MPSILFLANCQGAQYPNFLRLGSESFAAEWTTLKTIQAQAVRGGDAAWLTGQMEQADVLVAQPLYSMPVEEIRVAALRDFAARTGKTLIMIPALQFDAFLPGVVPSQWGDTPGYPFAANEDMSIAAAHASGLSVAEAVEFYHDVPLIPGPALRKLLDHNIAQYVARETDSSCDIIASDYYARNWKTSRLHFIKGHPLPEVTRHFTAALADQLEIGDFDPARTLGQPGPFQFCLPIRRWVKSGLGLTFEDPEDQVCCDGTYISLQDFIETMYAWYDSRGGEEITRRLQQLPPFRTALAACDRMAGPDTQRRA